MSIHTFRLGDIVALKLNPREPDRAYEVTRLLPSDGPEPAYRIKSVGEPFERMVREHELRALKVAGQVHAMVKRSAILH